MRSKLRTICAALLAVFALGAVASASASAAPEWYVKKAGVFKKVAEPVSVGGTVSWELIDTGTGKFGLEPGGVSCKAVSQGELKSGGISDIVTINSEECHQVKACEKIEGSAPPENLPWQLELYKEGSEIRSRIVSSGKGTPEFVFTCKIRGITKTDVCGMNTSTQMSNNVLSGFVEATFDAKSAKTNCTWGGTGKGELKGAFAAIKPIEKSGVEAIKVE